jgi:hypothetical protein
VEALLQEKATLEGRLTAMHDADTGPAAMVGQLYLPPDQVLAAQLGHGHAPLMAAAASICLNGCMLHVCYKSSART